MHHKAFNLQFLNLKVRYPTVNKVLGFIDFVNLAQNVSCRLSLIHVALDSGVCKHNMKHANDCC